MNIDNFQWFYEGFDPTNHKFGRVLSNDARHTIIHEPPAFAGNPDVEADSKLIAAAPTLARLLKKYVEEDEIIEGDGWEEINAQWLETKRASIAVLESIGVAVDCPKVVAVLSTRAY